MSFKRPDGNRTQKTSDHWLSEATRASSYPKILSTSYEGDSIMSLSRSNLSKKRLVFPACWFQGSSQTKF